MLPAGRRQLRILIAAPGQVRAYLTADLLRRAADRARLLPMVTDLLPASAHAADPGATTFRAACDALNIHPPQDTLSAPVDPLTGIPLFDVGIGLTGEAANSDVTGLARRWIRVAGDYQEPDLGDEPLAIRLALMRRGYGTPAGGDWVTADELETLRRWRALVAKWAQSPSGAMSRRHADAVTEALARDLDTAAALAALDALAQDTGVEDGVKFETFASADLMLGLDLARDVGR